MTMSTTRRDMLIEGRYRILDVIGRGGMADVYRARDERLGRLVAIKRLRETVDDRRAEARARSEALLLARLSHPSLVTLFDAGVEEGRPYLVMELIDGPSLAVQAPSEPDAVATVGAQLADGLAYMHGESLVHRDLKPANVLVAPTAIPWERVKLADFGIARLVDATHLTATGTAIGTAAYLAPEQVRGTPVGPEADVWSLGLILLECLTGASGPMRGHRPRRPWPAWPGRRPCPPRCRPAGPRSWRGCALWSPTSAPGPMRPRRPCAGWAAPARAHMQ